MKVDKKRLYSLIAIYAVVFYLIILIGYLICEILIGGVNVLFPIILIVIVALGSVFTGSKFYKVYDAGIKVETHKKNMFNRISSELEQPLNDIDNYVNMFDKNMELDAKEFCIENIKIETQCLRKAINDIMELEEIEKGIYELNSQTFSINRVLDEVLDKYWDIADNRDIELSFNNVKETPLNADIVRMTQVVDNFIYNAIVNTARGKKIQVAMDERGMVILAEGRVASQNELENMWNLEYYKQENNSEKKISGIGMYTSKRLLEKQGYTCGVVNDKKGVKYWIKFVN